jgi:hypothetical protein
MSEQAGGKPWKPWFWALAGTIIGGIIVAIVSYAVEGPIKELGKRPPKRLSYAITEVTNIYQRPADTNLYVQVLMDTNHIPVESLWGYRVRVWNSGTEALKDLNVEFQLSTNSSFYCLAERHNPQPPDQVGEIKSLPSHPNQVKTNHYQLLNPEHSDEVFFVGNMPTDLKVAARAEGLQIKKEIIEPKGANRRWWLSTIIPAIFATIFIMMCNAVIELFKSRRNTKIDVRLEELRRLESLMRQNIEKQDEMFQKLLRDKPRK